MEVEREGAGNNEQESEDKGTTENKRNDMIKRNNETKKGYTFLEVMISVAIFLIMTAAISKSFVSGFSTYRDSRMIQKDLETAQFAMNTLAKSLRTSSVVRTTTAAGSGWRGIKFYDYSQQRCFSYVFDTTEFSLKAGLADLPANTADPWAWCFGVAISATTQVTTGHVESGSFYVTKSVPTTGSKVVGRVVIGFVLKDKSTSLLKSQIQTSVSLRDYNYVGL
jgi:prepilin-type N-terminal cleavage/methylation domain-containing protein